MNTKIKPDCDQWHLKKEQKSVLRTSPYDGQIKQSLIAFYESSSDFRIACFSSSQFPFIHKKKSKEWGAGLMDRRA